MKLDRARFRTDIRLQIGFGLTDEDMIDDCVEDHAQTFDDEPLVSLR